MQVKVQLRILVIPVGAFAAVSLKCAQVDDQLGQVIGAFTGNAAGEGGQFGQLLGIEAARGCGVSFLWRLRGEGPMGGEAGAMHCRSRYRTLDANDACAIFR